ncbi:hypothetical protein CJ260_11675 [Megasphaera sp. ASD88]|uniref:hypothetical protein n=1 Tax=Megasphaera sp. ASD88 TaxID=2027407 RepID=UPI000BAB30D1|nr:hypothetical protein [Megasphaera sp. ASD88]PAV37993.1 hypothetical protein CJ260_11675 [Megasphaera sp. ASD88]
MYSEKIKSKVDAMFIDLSNRVNSILMDSFNLDEAKKNIIELVSSELTINSQYILSDMLFDLRKATLHTDFFADVSRQNRFSEVNLRYEIMSKYQFTPNTTVNYEEASKTVQALKIGGATFVIGGAIEIGAVLAAGLSVSSLVPIPISILIVASIGAALADYHVLEPAKNKKRLAHALNTYLEEVKKQFLKWFDDVEQYYNQRVEEIKQDMTR